MKQSIQLRLGQHLTMTPQLQQAIRLLQLSSLELHAEIQQAVESNPMLEVTDNADEQSDETPEGTDKGQAAAADAERASDASDASEAGDGDSAGEAYTDTPGSNADADVAPSSEIPDELPVDSSWDDIYDNVPSYSQGQEPTDREIDIHDTGTDTLHDHLIWQMKMASMSDTDRAIASTIIDSIDDDGYLTGTLENIHESLRESYDVELEEAEAVLRLIQNFDPAGVGARNLSECLLMQLRQLDPDTPGLNQAMLLVREHLPLLGSHDHAQLLRRMKLQPDELPGIVALIRTLNPRPGSQVSSARTEYIVPDVYVRKVAGTWRVELNSDASPRLRINPYYASLIRRADNSSDNTYLKNHLQEARWFLKSIQSRNETLLKVATSIVKHQQAFLEQGDEAMKALVLHDIAEEVSMHESTISRVTTRKYMHTPRGIYELKYFFSSHVSTANGGECSSTAIRALIRKLIASEDPAKPLSDSKIATDLAQQGINVARRTVAKYREAMRLPPSNERKRLI